MQAFTYPQHLRPPGSDVGWVQVRIVRSGQECSISIYDLLVGDILLVDTGEGSRVQGLGNAQERLKPIRS